MIKVLMCGNHPTNKGGMTSVISQILSHDWDNEGIEIKFVPTFYPGNNAVKSIYFIVACIKILINFIFFRPEIVHMHMSYKGSFSRKYLIHRLCKIFKIKDIIHLHGSEFEKWYKESNCYLQGKIRCLLKECDTFLVLGEKWETVIKNIEPDTNIMLINNAIEIPNTMVSWNDKKCQLLFMGVLIPRKGMFDLLNALKILKDQQKLEKIRLAIAGTGPDEEKLKKFCDENGLNKYVRFCGWVTGDKKNELICSSQVSVLTSYNEGLPISILEAISYGMPVVATDVGDISSAVIDDLNGYLIKPRDIETLIEKILFINNQETFTKMSVKSREIAENKFSSKIFYKKLSNCYHKLICN
ncbi:MAG: glycosyltransferase family 4 protein [Sedimentibacter sp.]|uniref:glycosyltransferase family 4 protein n=1 Tax=Sedimentibacter sp. TaxID=1960295 RepID=UPI0031587D3D